MIAKKRQDGDLNPKIKKESSLASFIERPLPEEDEVINFERAVNRELRDQEIDSHLLDVYSDKKGKKIDVSHMNVKKKPKFLWQFLKKVFFFSLIIFIAYYIYNQYFENNNDISSLKLELIAPERIVAGENFDYEIEYSNPTKYIFSEIDLEMQYPDNFVFELATLNSIPVSPNSGNYGFNLPALAPGESANLKIKGYLVNLPDSVNLAIARLSYLPGTFSSHFKKESSASTIVSSLGFLVDVESSKTVFLGQENELKLFFSGFSDKLLTENLEEFDLFFTFKDASGAEIISASSSLSALLPVINEEQKLTLEKLSAFSWHVLGLNQEMSRQEVSFKYKVKNRVDDFFIEIALRRRFADKELVFWRKILKPELISNDLSLNLILNNSKNDQPLDFGSTLNYSLNYSNQGSKSYQDVVIMAALEGLALDWSSLKASQGGERTATTIMWSKNEMSELAEIRPGQKGKIDFNIKLKEFDQNFLGKNLDVIAYTQYSVAGQKITANENMSNKIINPINSDLHLKEELLYFNKDNYPVGSGPLPPEVGQSTEFRVYWQLENNLHELREVKAVFDLPKNISFIGKVETDVGRIYFSEETKQVIWEIGLLPTSKYLSQAAFSLSVNPGEDDRNKILVLSSGTKVSAIDTETNGILERKTSTKTSRLEDDEIAALMNNSGLVK